MHTAALVCLGLMACQSKSAPEAPPPAARPAPTPDRLAPGEDLPESETAFGLPMPAGLHLVRHFDDAAYFSGDVDFDKVFEHVKEHTLSRDVEIVGQGVRFARAYVAGDDSKRLLRIEIERLPHGTQLHVQDITPPPALTGVSEAEIWRKAGRNPDGTPIDQNQAY